MVTASKYRITAKELLQTIENWEHLINFKVNLRVDVEDCVAAFARFEIDPEELLQRYAEATKYDLNPEKMIQNFIVFAEALLEKGLVNHHFIEKVEAYK